MLERTGVKPGTGVSPFLRPEVKAHMFADLSGTRAATRVYQQNASFPVQKAA